jgi:hypothetical protein
VRLAIKIAIVACLLMGSNRVRAQENPLHGFLNIPFGATREAWLSELKSRFKMKPGFILGQSQWPMSGSGMDLFWTSDNVYCLKDYALGDRLFTVLFYFNNDGKFYGFRLKGENDPHSRTPRAMPDDPKHRCESGLTDIESQVLLEDVLFLQNVFETKYGTPTIVQKFETAEICENPGRIFWVQKTSRYLAAVGTICTVHAGGHKSRSEYSPVAVVYDQELKGKPVPGATLMSPVPPPHVTEERKIIEKAAGSF